MLQQLADDLGAFGHRDIEDAAGLQFLVELGGEDGDDRHGFVAQTWFMRNPSRGLGASLDQREPRE